MAFSEISRPTQTTDSTTTAYARIAQDINSPGSSLESKYQAKSAAVDHILPNFSISDSSTPQSGAGSASDVALAGGGKITPDCHATPDRHYVGQAESQLHQALKDVNSNKVGQGVDDIKNAMTDLGREHNMISTAQAGGKTAENLLKTHIIEPQPGTVKGSAGQNDAGVGGPVFMKAAEAQLTKTIDGLKGSGFNTEARKDYENALSALKHGNSDSAIQNIDAAENHLRTSEQIVSAAKTDLDKGLQAFKSGSAADGKNDINSALDKLDYKPKELPPPPAPAPLPIRITPVPLKEPA